MAKSKADLSPVSYTLLSKLEELAQVERVDPKALMASNGAATTAEQVTLDRLLADGFQDADEAFRSLFAVFGLQRYADKFQLAAERTPFFIQRIVQRIGAAYHDPDNDDWAIQIATIDGEAQMLTFERNPGRDKMLLTTAIILKQYGSMAKNPVILERIEKSDGTAFYIISPYSERIAQSNVMRDVSPPLEGAVVGG